MWSIDRCVVRCSRLTLLAPPGSTGDSLCVDRVVSLWGACCFGIVSDTICFDDHVSTRIYQV